MLRGAALIEQLVEVSSSEPGRQKQGIEADRQDYRKNARKQTVYVGKPSARKQQPLLDVVAFVTGAVLAVEVVGRLSAPLQQRWVKWTAGRSHDAYIFHDFVFPLVGRAIAAIPGIAWPARMLLAIPGSILVFSLAIMIGVVVRRFEVPRKLLYGR